MLSIRVGQNRIITPYMTVYLVISLPKIPYTHRIYMVLAKPIMYACYDRKFARVARDVGLEMIIVWVWNAWLIFGVTSLRLHLLLCGLITCAANG
jgi:hypothetical protein